MPMTEEQKKAALVPVNFRMAPERRAMLQAIADAQFDGNLSDLMRDMVDERISQSLNRRLRQIGRGEVG